MTNTESDPRFKADVLSARATYLRSAGTGAVVSALVGPTVGAFTLLLSSFISAAQVPSHADDLVGFVGWGLILSGYGIAFMGLPSVVLGAIGGVFIRWRTPIASRSRVCVEASVLGMLLGSAVPVIVLLAGWGSKDVMPAFIGAGAVAGPVCALSTLAILHRFTHSANNPVPVS